MIKRDNRHPPLVEQATHPAIEPAGLGGVTSDLLEVPPEPPPPDIHSEPLILSEGGSPKIWGQVSKPHGSVAQDARDLLAMERKPIKSDVTHTSAPALEHPGLKAPHLLRDNFPASAARSHAKPCPHCRVFTNTGTRVCKHCGYEFYPKRPRVK